MLCKQASKLNIELGKKMVSCYIWSIDLYGSETSKLYTSVEVTPASVRVLTQRPLIPSFHVGCRLGRKLFRPTSYITQLKCMLYMRPVNHRI